MPKSPISKISRTKTSTTKAMTACSKRSKKTRTTSAALSTRTSARTNPDAKAIEGFWRRGRSSVGRALEWHSRGQGFDSPRLHQPTLRSSEGCRAEAHGAKADRFPRTMARQANFARKAPEGQARLDCLSLDEIP